MCVCAYMCVPLFICNIYSMLIGPIYKIWDPSFVSEDVI